MSKPVKAARETSPSSVLSTSFVVGVIIYSATGQTLGFLVGSGVCFLALTFAVERAKRGLQNETIPLAPVLGSARQLVGGITSPEYPYPSRKHPNQPKDGA